MFAIHPINFLISFDYLRLLEITWTPVVGFARNLVEIVPRSLPELFKQLRDQNNRQKQSKTSDKILRKIIINQKKRVFLGFPCLTWNFLIFPWKMIRPVGVSFCHFGGFQEFGVDCGEDFDS